MRVRRPAVRRREAPAAPVREWATFADPDDPKRRWLVDVTWLTSSWMTGEVIVVDGGGALTWPS